MNIREKLDELKFSIGRFDHYYDSVNNKGNLYLAVNTFILGGAIGGYAALDNVYHFNGWFLVLLIAVLLSNVISVGYTLGAIKPFLKKKNGSRSMIYFRDIDNASEVTIGDFWSNLTEEKMIDDLLVQYKILAGGLTRKFVRLQYATTFIAFQISGVALFGIILLLKY